MNENNKDYFMGYGLDSKELRARDAGYQYGLIIGFVIGLTVATAMAVMLAKGIV